jgi:cell wall-associated NlpC family hydrolase
VTTPTEVVNAARRWVGTPFAHLHRTRGHAVDCAGLVIGVARELGLVLPDFDVQPYAPSPDGRTLRALCDEHLEHAGLPVLGGVVLVAWAAGPPQHLGIVGEFEDGALTMIHAENRRQRRVIEQRLVFSRAMRLVACYRLPGVH